MNAARFTGACASALVHAALLISLPARPPADDPPPRATPVRESDEGLDVRLLPALAGGAGLACDQKYRGIGTIVSYSGYVREVVAGGPADLAGVRVGDRFMNDAVFLRDSWPLDKALEIVVERDGRQLRLPVRIGRICYEGSKL